MQINAPAIEFFAFIGVAAWLVFIGPKTARSKPQDQAPAADARAADAQGSEPPEQP